MAAAAPSTARAQAAANAPDKADRAAAREAYDKGTQAFDKGDYVAALDHFVKANALIPSVQAMFWIARSQDQAGRLDEAIAAYDGVLARADFDKLSPDKQATVKERQAALKKQKEPAPPAPTPPQALPEPPAPAPPPPLVVETPMAPMPLPSMHDDADDFLPKRNTAELGIMGGTLFVGNSNNLAERRKSPSKYDMPIWQIGARAAFFPERVFGIEAEYAHGFGKVRRDDERANFDVVRGHLIGQLPTARAVPFALLGAGMLRAKSDASGRDRDLLFEAGIGLKVMATEILVPRIDARVGLTQKEGGGFADGVVFHPELLLGLSFVLGR
jgi:tetratricopeptide (TPR) repeat protein